MPEPVDGSNFEVKFSGTHALNCSFPLTVLLELRQRLDESLPISKLDPHASSPCEVALTDFDG